ncbi:MAG: YwiC-like family protein, partial [Planctomycetaceae bacterium]
DARTAPSLSLVPKEHGASFMSVHALLLGLVAGFAAGGRDLAGAVLALALGALFLPITGAVSVLTHPRFAAAARRRLAILGTVAAVVGALALVHGPRTELLAVGAAGAGLAGAYGALRRKTGPRSLPTQLAAIASICLLAPVTWLLVAGPDGPWALAAPAAFLSFGVTVPYVRARVQRRRLGEQTLGERLRGGTVALAWQVGALTLAAGAVVASAATIWLPIAYLPGVVKTFAGLGRPERRPPIKKIGYLETVVSTVFAVLAGLGLGLAA